MKGDYSDRQRERDEARRRAKRSDRAFREKQNSRGIKIVRESANIQRLTGSINRLGEGDAPSRSQQRKDLFEEWDRRVECALGGIAKCPGLSQTTRDRWRERLEGLLVFSAGAKLRLDALNEEVKSCLADADNRYSKSSTDPGAPLDGGYELPPGLANIFEVKLPRRGDLTGISARMDRAILKNQGLEPEMDAEQRKNLYMERNGLVSIEMDIYWLLHMYDKYQSL